MLQSSVSIDFNLVEDLFLDTVEGSDCRSKSSISPRKDSESIQNKRIHDGPQSSQGVRTSAQSRQKEVSCMDAAFNPVICRELALA